MDRGQAMDLMRIWYVDEEALDSLYHQIRGITKTTVSENKSQEREGELEVGLTHAPLLSWLPFQLSLKGRYSLGKNVITQQEISNSIENKIQVVQAYLREKRVLAELVRYDAHVTGYVWISDRFSLLELYYLGQKDINLIKLTGDIDRPSELMWHMHWSVEVDNAERQYENSDKMITEVSVEMYLGGDKVKRGIRHITTHIEKYHPFDFGVIGDLMKIDNLTYVLKPIVIYQDDDYIG